jgi:hypothetical protein
MAYKGILFDDDHAVTVNCRTSMKALSGYFNLCLSVQFDTSNEYYLCKKQSLRHMHIFLNSTVKPV